VYVPKELQDVSTSLPLSWPPLRSLFQNPQLPVDRRAIPIPMGSCHSPSLCRVLSSLHWEFLPVCPHLSNSYIFYHSEVWGKRRESTSGYLKQNRIFWKDIK
jgi:hypothetical protein